MIGKMDPKIISCLIFIILPIANGQLPPKNTTTFHSKLADLYEIKINELQNMAEDEWNFLNNQFSSIIARLNTVRENAAIMDGKNATSCYEFSKNAIINKTLAATENIQYTLEKYISQFERMIHNKIWLPDMQWEIAHCTKGEFITKKLLDCMAENTFAKNNEPTIQTIYHDILNTIQTNKTALSLAFDLQNITTTLNQSTLIIMRDFDICVKIRPIMEIFRNGRLLQRSDNINNNNYNNTLTVVEVKNRNLTNLYTSRRGKFEHLEFRYWQTIEKVITRVESTYKNNVINTVMSRGINISCCLELPMMSIDKAVKNAYNQNTDCFKNESSTYERFAIETLSASRLTAYLPNCYENASEKLQIFECLDSSMTNESEYIKKLYENIQNALENNNNLTEPFISSCIHEVMDRYRVSVNDEYSKIDTCVINQRTKNCTNKFSSLFQREIRIVPNTILDSDLYMWAIHGIY